MEAGEGIWVTLLCVVCYNMVVFFCLPFQVSVILQPRYAHSTTACYLGPRLTEVTMFGGTPKPFSGNEDKQPKLADTTLLQFSELTGISRGKDLSRDGQKVIRREDIG